MIRNGSLVKMRLGHSGPGTVLEVMNTHPRAGLHTFAPIRHILEKPHARVFWHDMQESELICTHNLEVMA